MTKGSTPPSPTDDRQARLAAALKANIARRKAQVGARARGQAGAEQPATTDNDSKDEEA